MMKKPIVTIHRYIQDENQSSGVVTVFIDGQPVYSGVSLERGWRNNESNVSCVPAGEYPLKLEYSPRFKKDLWELKEVPNRSEAKFHSANYWNQLNGCIALGLKYADINADNYADVVKSVIAMSLFHEVLRGFKEATLIITTEKGLF